jgi:small-conductance mechanosensitive channel
MNDILNIVYWNNTVQDYLIFLATVFVCLIAIIIVKKILISALKNWAEKTVTTLDDMLVKLIGKYIVPLTFFISLYLSTNLLTLSDKVENAVYVVSLAIIMIFAALALARFLVFLFNRYLEKKNQDSQTTSVKWIGVLIKIVVWIIAFLLFLDNLDIKITALMAGLGVGGIAVAFAANAVLQDLFSFVTIFFDRPFEIGDFINVGDMSGSIEHIGIKTTRVRSLSGEQLVFANRDLTNSRIRNYKRMETRRVAFTIGVTYSTGYDKLKLIPGMMKQIIDSVENTDFDRAHLKSFGDFAILFEVVYYVLSQDYALYMDVNQEINLAIKSSFDTNGIEFAFPTQSIYIEKQ